MHDEGSLIESWYLNHVNAACAALHSSVVVPLVVHSRMDERFVTATFRQDMTDNGKYVIRLIVSATDAETRRIDLDGGARRIHRVGTSNEWGGVRWLSCDRNLLSGCHPAAQGSSLPVY